MDHRVGFTRHDALSSSTARISRHSHTHTLSLSFRTRPLGYTLRVQGMLPPSLTLPPSSPSSSPSPPFFSFSVLTTALLGRTTNSYTCVYVDTYIIHTCRPNKAAPPAKEQSRPAGCQSDYLYIHTYIIAGRQGTRARCFNTCMSVQQSNAQRAAVMHL
jgi:hypothetical protein